MNKAGRKAQKVRAEYKHFEVIGVGRTPEWKMNYGSLKTRVSSVRWSKTGEAKLTWVGKDNVEDHFPMLSSELVSSPMSGVQCTATTPSGSCTPESIP